MAEIELTVSPKRKLGHPDLKNVEIEYDPEDESGYIFRPESRWMTVEQMETFNELITAALAHHKLSQESG